MMMVALMYGMMPSAPMAQRSRAPPVNMLYMPSKPPLSPWAAKSSKYFDSNAPSRPGTGSTEITRQIPRTSRVKMIRDFSSGILKQFANVLMMVFSIAVSLKHYSAFGGFADFLALAAPDAGLVAAGFGALTNSQVPP